MYPLIIGKEILKTKRFHSSSINKKLILNTLRNEILNPHSAYIFIKRKVEYIPSTGTICDLNPTTNRKFWVSKLLTTINI